MRRSTPFADIVRHLTPFFVSRQVVCGAGRVGIGQDGRGDGFQISQRADFFEVEVGLETTLKRPIINTRDEPHADPAKYRRLHVIIGDANLAEVSTYLKVGTTALVLAMIEDRYSPRDLARRAARCETLHAGLARPDPAAPARARRRPDDDRRPAPVGVPRPGPQVRRRAARRRRRQQTRDVLDALGVGADPARARPDGVRPRARLGGQAAAAGAVPRPRRPGVGRRQAGPDRPAVRRPAPARRASTTGWCGWAGWSGCSPRRGRAAMHEPPNDTRAYFRGRCLASTPTASPPHRGTR